MRSTMMSRVWVGLILLLPALPVLADKDHPGQLITPNFRDADIRQIAEAVSAATGRNFIIDPRVRAEVTMLSSTPLSPEAFYQAFLSILEVYGFNAEPAGAITKIVPNSDARQHPGVDLPERTDGSVDEFVTQVIAVRNVSSAQLVPILRPLIPQYGHLAAYPASNILVISDRASNVERLLRIIRRIDQAVDQEVDLVALQNASAPEIARVVSALYQQGAGAEGGSIVKIIAEERSNSLLIGGDEAQRVRVRALIAHLDTPLQSGGDTRVRYLHFADAEKVAPTLKEYLTTMTQQAAAAAGATQGGGQAQAQRSALVLADKATNSLIMVAPPKLMNSLIEIVDKLDIRRAQVLVEAVIVEVNADKTSDLGVNWAAWGKGSNVPAASFVESTGGSSIVDLASLAKTVAGGSTPSSTSALTGTTLAVGRIAAGGINFAATLRALNGDANTNIVATPSTITMDNQEAELKVAQEVPFITGQYANSGATGSNSSVSPFQTVQRQEVGTILKVTPQIAAEGDSVVLKISVESSSVAATSVSSVDITTNKRTVSTNVLIEDGGIIVLGGLISDTVTRSEQRVPWFSRIPLLGAAFKTRDYSRAKNNLMVFIRPKILRTAAQAAVETGGKYDFMLEEQRKASRAEAPPLLPHEKPPELPFPAPSHP
jgi:general secretion pathway protein D